MKKFLFLALLITTGAIAQTKKPVKTATLNGKLQGKVSYAFKYSDPQKPDVGAVVVIHQSDVEPEAANDGFANYMKAKMLTNLYKNNTQDMYYFNQLKNLNAETPEKFEALDMATAVNYFKIKKDPKSIVTTTDAEGNYTADLKPGRYEVIFLSKNKPDQTTIMEVNGMIYNRFVTIKPGETTKQDQSFK
jgi:hypothetical protein